MKTKKEKLESLNRRLQKSIRLSNRSYNMWIKYEDETEKLRDRIDAVEGAKA